MRRRAADDGVAIVEMLLLTPVLILVAMGVTQVALVALAGSAAQDAALAAARADQLGLSSQAAARAAVDDGMSVTATRLDGGPHRWKATVTPPKLVPFMDVTVVRTAELP